MTSDGIAYADWDHVHELAVEIVNCSAADNEAAEARARASLMALLNQLDEKLIELSPGSLNASTRPSGESRPSRGLEDFRGASG
jgi:hypothetical protein